MTRPLFVAVALAGALSLGVSCAREPAPAPAASSQVPATGATPTEPDRTAVRAAAKTLIARTPFATLTTIGEDGAPQSRIVEPFTLEDDFTVWIATNGSTRKVRQIEHDPRVTLLYFDQIGPGYVSLLGTAAIVRDPAEKEKRWKDSWGGFYKDKNRGEDYTLVRVTPTRLEISSPSQKMNNDPVTWQPVTIAIGKDAR
jgi:PPOX class probable F420-dependent enzyme